jgi:hypothetical protein
VNYLIYNLETRDEREPTIKVFNLHKLKFHNDTLSMSVEKLREISPQMQNDMYQKLKTKLCLLMETN